MELAQLEPDAASNPGSKHPKSQQILNASTQKHMENLPGPSVAGVRKHQELTWEMHVRHLVLSSGSGLSAEVKVPSLGEWYTKHVDLRWYVGA